MFNIVREEMEWGGRKLTLETGKVARQADGAVIANASPSSSRTRERSEAQIGTPARALALVAINTGLCLAKNDDQCASR